MFFFSHRAPTKEQWADVRPLVASWHHPGDVVVISPFWAEPMARLKFGDALMPSARGRAPRHYPLRAGARGIDSVGGHVSELKGWQVAREVKQGLFTLRELTNPNAVTVTYDFADHLYSGIGRCSHRARRGRFTLPSYRDRDHRERGFGRPAHLPGFQVCLPRAALARVRGAHRHRKIRSSTPGSASGRTLREGDAEIVSRFRHVHWANKLYGYAGMGWVIERDLAVAPFTIRVTVDGEEVGRVVHQPGEFWKPFDIPLGSAAHTVVMSNFT